MAESQIPFVRLDGTTIWLDSQGRFHREDGPAIIYKNGTQAWFLNGCYHRKDGPAVIYSNGKEEWYFNGKFCDNVQKYAKVVGWTDKQLADYILKHG